MDIEGVINNQKSIFSNYSQKEFVGHKKRIYSVDWNSEGNKLASASADSTIRIWNLETNSFEKGQELRGHTDMIEQVSWHPTDQNILASVSTDKTMRLWDVRVPKANIRTDKTKGSNINLAWHPTGKTLGVGNRDDVITFIDYSGSLPQKLLKFDNEVNEFSWDPNGDILFVTIGFENTGQLYMLYGDSPSLPPLDIIESHRGTCYCINFDKTGKYFATGAADAIIGIWNASEIICLNNYTLLEGQVRHLSFSSDGKYLATASEDEFIDIIETENCNFVHRISCKGPQNIVTWHPKEYLLAFAGEEKSKASSDEGIIHLFQAN